MNQANKTRPREGLAAGDQSLTGILFHMVLHLSLVSLPVRIQKYSWQ